MCWNEAEPLFRRALEGSERVLGPEHPHTLTYINNLAALIDEDKSRLDEAEPLYRRCLDMREKVLGADHPSTLTVVQVCLLFPQRFQVVVGQLNDDKKVQQFVSS